MDNKISVSWDDLNSRKVDTRLKEQAALARNRAYAELDADSVTPQPASSPMGRVRLLYNAPVYMALFGLLGGLLAWALGLVLAFKPSAQAEAIHLIKSVEEVRDAERRGRLTSEDAWASIREINREGRHNPYFVIATDPTLTDAEKTRLAEQLAGREQMKAFVANVLSYGAWGLVIALCLGIAEPVTNRNVPAVVINASVAAAMGLLGGVVVALFVDRLYAALGGGVLTGGLTSGRQVFARAVTWGVMGMFLTAGAGLVLRSPKKFAIGLAGGLAGGLIGGALYDPVASFSGRPELSRLVALCAIGLVAGAATGAIENVIKSGWLRVTAGVIAGKQFILYRNPTFIVSGPDCQIYLFKDRRVGRRHAAIHIVPGGYELEDLPLGAPTMINGKPAKRARLRHGDRVQIGATAFLFQEKAKEAQ